MRRLTARRVQTLTRPGRHSDGHGLHLFVRSGGRRSWVQRITLPDGRRVDRGLGGADIVSLAEARVMALNNKITVRQGRDPFTAQRSAVPTFRVACRRAAESAPMKGLGAQNRRRALERYCGSILDRRLDQIRRADVIVIVAPVRADKPSMGLKLHGWIRGALAWGVAREHVEYNVADGIGAALPKRNGRAEHHAALPYGEVGAALAKVDASTARETVKAAIKLLALSACRSGEVRGATWDEIDLDARVWRIPASRMKTGVESPRTPVGCRSGRAEGYGAASWRRGRPGVPLEPRAAAVVRHDPQGVEDDDGDDDDTARLPLGLQDLGERADGRGLCGLRDGAGAPSGLGRGAVIRPVDSVRQAPPADGRVGRVLYPSGKTLTDIGATGVRSRYD